MKASSSVTTPHVRHQRVTGGARLSAARRSLHEAQEAYALELVDHHGSTLFRVAWVVSGDCDIASAAVVRVIVAASLDHAGLDVSRSNLAELSRRSMWLCLEPALADDASSAGPRDEMDLAGAGDPDTLRSIPPRERALAALTLFGDHTYREAAAALGVAPALAADELRGALHAIAELLGPAAPTGSLGRPA